jgi:hypothetical protein
MTAKSIAACVLAGLLLGPGAAGVEEENDLRDLRIGMSIDAIPAEEYVDLTCAAASAQKLERWADYRRCPADPPGLRAVSFRFNDLLNPLAQINETYEGTKIAGHPVLLALLIDGHGIVDALRIDTDPHARLFWRKKAYLLALTIKNRFGEDGWECRDAEPSGGETPIGGLFIKEHCEKTSNGREFLLDQAAYRRPGQAMSDFVNATHLEIRRSGSRS